MAGSSNEIERKWLIEALPEGFGRIHGENILQGYLTVETIREIRVRMAGSDCFMTIKQGGGLVRKEVEIRISRDQFRHLWPLTEGCRLEKRRHKVRHRGLTVEVDIYSGSLEGLMVAEVEFPSVEASDRFIAPEYFGDEVTDREEYRNAALATHGIPVRGRDDHRVGALPYLFRNGKLHIVLVTNSAQTKWILPKGQLEEDMTRHEVALMESVEEAGVIGSFISGTHAQCRLKDKTTLTVYPLLVTTLLHKWPEASFRKRQVLPLEKATRLINDKGLAACVERLGAKLEEAGPPPKALDL